MSTVDESVAATPEDLEHADNDQHPVGHGRMLRKEDPRFIRWMGRYVDDITLRGMLHLAILRSPVAHANIVSIDASAAPANPTAKAWSPRPARPEKGRAGVPAAPVTVAGDATVGIGAGPAPVPPGSILISRRPLGRTRISGNPSSCRRCRK